MSKRKISATIEPERLERAQQVTGTANLSQLLDQALAALVERELEERWLAAHADDLTDTGLPGEVPVDLSDLPWDEE